MARVTGIGGIFLRSRDPEARAAWFFDVLGIDMRSGFWLQDAGATVLPPFDDNTAYFPADQPFMLTLRVDDLSSMIAQLSAKGIEVVQDPAWNSDIGAFARITDPEGLPIELWQPGPAAPSVP